MSDLNSSTIAVHVVNKTSTRVAVELSQAQILELNSTH